MKIPNSFTIAGGKKINISIEDRLDDNLYGQFSDVDAEIKIAEHVYDKEVSDEDMERTFWHEFVHCMNYFYNCECDESLAQTFSNFLYEFIHSKK